MSSMNTVNSYIERHSDVLQLNIWAQRKLAFMRQRFVDYSFEIRKLNAKLEEAVNLENAANFVKLTRTRNLFAPTFMSGNEIMNETSVLPLTVNILAACVCMGFSAMYHLFNVKNPEVARNLARLDYAGIAFLIYGSAIPAASYGFACDSVAYQRQIFSYLLGIGCLAATYATFSPALARPKFNYLRAFMFCGLGLAASVVIAIQHY